MFFLLQQTASWRGWEGHHPWRLALPTAANHVAQVVTSCHHFSTQLGSLELASQPKCKAWFPEVFPLSLGYICYWKPQEPARTAFLGVPDAEHLINVFALTQIINNDYVIIITIYWAFTICPTLPYNWFMLFNFHSTQLLPSVAQSYNLMTKIRFLWWWILLEKNSYTISLTLKISSQYWVLGQFAVSRCFSFSWLPWSQGFLFTVWLTAHLPTALKTIYRNSAVRQPLITWCLQGPESVISLIGPCN